MDETQFFDPKASEVHWLPEGIGHSVVIDYEKSVVQAISIIIITSNQCINNQLWAQFIITMCHRSKLFAKIIPASWPYSAQPQCSPLRYRVWPKANGTQPPWESTLVVLAHTPWVVASRNWMNHYDQCKSSEAGDVIIRWRMRAISPEIDGKSLDKRLGWSIPIISWFLKAGSEIMNQHDYIEAANQERRTQPVSINTGRIPFDEYIHKFIVCILYIYTHLYRYICLHFRCMHIGRDHCAWIFTNYDEIAVIHSYHSMIHASVDHHHQRSAAVCARPPPSASSSTRTRLQQTWLRKWLTNGYTPAVTNLVA